jgi:hypothetical protein
MWEECKYSLWSLLLDAQCEKLSFILGHKHMNNATVTGGYTSGYTI